uniref:VWFD domain-containing protein n=1 Tax=Eptatretus burgeri TaxID=7764 RepID=A0A8C4PY82_EPTBU
MTSFRKTASAEPMLPFTEDDGTSDWILQQLCSFFHKIYVGKVCGLCANFNGDVLDDMSTRAGMPVTSALDFGNSWKMFDDCPDITEERDPCTKNVYRQVWAEKKCSMIQSDIFKDCHKEVYHIPYYEACVRDSCACDSGGDCECLCTAIAAYAAACNEAGVCIRWRTPELCRKIELSAPQMYLSEKANMKCFLSSSINQRDIVIISEIIYHQACQAQH